MNVQYGMLKIWPQVGIQRVVRGRLPGPLQIADGLEEGAAAREKPLVVLFTGRHKNSTRQAVIEPREVSDDPRVKAEMDQEIETEGTLLCPGIESKSTDDLGQFIQHDAADWSQVEDPRLIGRIEANKKGNHRPGGEDAQRGGDGTPLRLGFEAEQESQLGGQAQQDDQVERHHKEMEFGALPGLNPCDP